MLLFIFASVYTANEFFELHFIAALQKVKKVKVLTFAIALLT